MAQEHMRKNNDRKIVHRRMNARVETELGGVVQVFNHQSINRYQNAGYKVPVLRPFAKDPLVQNCGKMRVSAHIRSP